MTSYKITSSAGVDMGVYAGSTPTEALDAMARDAGYRDQAAAAEVAGAFEGTVVEGGVVRATDVTIAIARSVSHTEIVNLPWSQEAQDELSLLCDDSVEASTTTWEAWGTDDDGAEWRVHLDGVRDPAVHCGCGEWSGERCEWTGPESETLVVEYMPEQHRASHAAAGTRGTYPHNGAVRIRVARACADSMIECDGEWCSEVAS